MEPVAIDHVNLRIPTDGREPALAFYRDALGFEADRLDAHEAGDLPFFAVRLTPDSVIHLWPDPDFEPPTGSNYDHVSIRLADSIGAIHDRLETAGVGIEDEREVLGAAGWATAVYVRDPFGYLVELKAGRD
jgi:catechol 2,3-dioxygenase-like lactoylglutathione lyase family enzyme